jgi:hypothetical protein
MHRTHTPGAGSETHHKELQMGTTTSIESQRALAWIVRQLSWERTLEKLRTQAPAETTEEKVAA